MTLRNRLLILLTVVAAASTAALASMPAARHGALDVKRRFKDPRGCCEADPDMCPQVGPRPTLTRTQALTTLKRQGDTVRACLTEATPLAKVTFHIGPDGVTSRVAVAGELPDDVRRCLHDAVSALRFPATELGLGVPLTFRFERPRR